jgi:hypothetical protein
LMAASVIPAYLSNRFVENPIRFGTAFKPSGRAIGMGLALTALGVGVGLGLGASASAGVDEAKASTSLGAAALLDPANKDVDWAAVRSVDQMRPLATEAVDDRPAFYDDGSGCQVRDGDPVPKPCTSGDPSADRTVVIVGDSKIAQWQPAISAIGRREGFKVVQFTKSACSFTDVDLDRKNNPDCRAWGRTVLKDVVRLDPDLVIVSHRQGKALPKGATDRGQETEDAMVGGLVSYWSTFTRAGIPVVALLDNPAPSDQPVYECVAQNPKNLDRCAFDRDQGVAASGAPAALRAAGEVPGASVADMTPTICPDGDRCAAVIGNVLVYRQTTHLTKSFVESAEAQLSAALFDATKGGFGEALPRD